MKIKSNDAMELLNHRVVAMLKTQYMRVLIPEPEGGYSAQVLEFPGCFSQGETPGEAIDNLESAAEGWLLAAIDQGQEIPEPAMNTGYSGRISLRIPRGLHRRASTFAILESISLNQFIISAIAERVGYQSQRRKKRKPNNKSEPTDA